MRALLIIFLFVLAQRCKSDAQAIEFSQGKKTLEKSSLVSLLPPISTFIFSLDGEGQSNEKAKNSTEGSSQVGKNSTEGSSHEGNSTEGSSHEGNSTEGSSHEGETKTEVPSKINIFGSLGYIKVFQGSIVRLHIRSFKAVYLLSLSLQPSFSQSF